MTWLTFYLKRLNEDISDRFQQISDLIFKLKTAGELDQVEEASLDWEIVHLKTTLVDVHKNIKNFEDRLRLIANKPIQE